MPTEVEKERFFACHFCTIIKIKLHDLIMQKRQDQAILPGQ